MKIEITKLDSGITVASELVPHVESFSLGIWFKVGSRDEIGKNNGISHFLEHMFFKGTPKRSSKKIAEEIESVGGYLNAFTSKEHTCFYCRGLKYHLEKMFSVLSDMIQNPLLPEKEIIKEAGVIIDEMMDIEDTPEELIFDRFESGLFRGSTLGLPIIGSEKNVKNFTRDDLLKFIKENYGFNKMFIIASGSVNHQKLVKLTEKYFREGVNSVKPRRNRLNYNSLKSVHIKKEVQQSHMILGNTTYGRKHKKRRIVSVMSSILGEGSSSRLFQSLREKNGLTYQINSFLNSFYDVSSFGVYFSTNLKSMEKANRLVINEFNKIKQKIISERELNKAKEFIKGNLLISLENTTNRMFWIAQSLVYFNKIKTISDIISEINSVSAQDIISVANQVLNDEGSFKIVISPDSALNTVNSYF